MKKTGGMHLCLAMLSLYQLTMVSGQVINALVEMEELLDTESVLMDTLEGYIAVTQDKVARVRRHLEEFRKEHEVASNGVQEYLSNPINAYHLTQRLTSKWKEVETLLNNDVGREFLDNAKTSLTETKFPTDRDLNGAALALVRLQNTYKLDPSSMARGELNGVQFNTELTAGDCFEIGRQSYHNNDYYHTALWMTEALKRHDEEGTKTIPKEAILEWVAYSMYMQGDVQSALKYTHDLLQENPSHEAGLKNKAIWSEHLTARSLIDGKADSIYERLCRGEDLLSEAVKSKLKCRYVDFGRPYLRIAPFKEEEAFLKPRLVIYHEVLSDEEIAVIQSMAKPRLERSLVLDPQNTPVLSNIRTSRHGWLFDEEDPHITTLNRRVEDMTGLTTSSAEALQVVSYGIGGHYEPHMDYDSDEENPFAGHGHGNRVATVLFYMNDVAQGGATVFPRINVTVHPKKGTAAVWYNLFRNGRGDDRSMHAACPVLLGPKWVCNKWLHMYGQEFRRRCGLTQGAVKG